MTEREAIIKDEILDYLINPLHRRAVKLNRFQIGRIFKQEKQYDENEIIVFVDEIGNDAHIMINKTTVITVEPKGKVFYKNGGYKAQFKQEQSALLKDSYTVNQRYEKIQLEINSLKDGIVTNKWTRWMSVLSLIIAILALMWSILG